MKRPPPDAAACVELPGWQHRYIAANGSRFHVVDVPAVGDVAERDRPTLVFLHGFPQFWWAWRHQLRAAARAGYRCIAMDLRGYGGSDKPPRGYDTFTLAADVDAVIRSLGLTDVVCIGHSWGGWVTWAMPTLHPATVRAIAVVATAHPSRTLIAAANPMHLGRLRRPLGFQLPIAPERAIETGNLVAQVLSEWSGTPDWPGAEEIERYTETMRIPSAAHTAMEYYRWAFRSRIRADGRRFQSAIRRTIRVPVLQLHGDRDPHVAARHATGSGEWVGASYTWRVVPGGHFLAEENPLAVSTELLGWLAELPHR